MSTAHFKDGEFACRCCGEVVVSQELLERLEQVRLVYGPMVVVSGYRCKRHNSRVGGVSRSYHTRGLAADIKCTNGADRMRLVRAALEAGFSRIGVYKTFVHLDIGPTPRQVLWLG